MKRRYLIFIFIYFLSSLISVGQSDADVLIDKLKDRTNQILAFDVDAIINIDVDFIEIKEREVKISYKAPGEFNFDAKGLFLLPKNGMQMEYMTLFNKSHTAISAGQEIVRDINTEIVKIIPESIESDIILAQLWIDPFEVRILRMKTFTKSSGSYIINFEYANSGDNLPAKLEVAFEISNMSMPIKMMNDFMNQSGAEKDSLPKEAKVLIDYSNYNITYKNPDI